MAELKVSLKKVKELKKRIAAKTLTEDDFRLIEEILEESIEIGLIAPPKKHDRTS